MEKKKKEFKLINNMRVHRFHTGEMTQATLADKVGVSRQTIIAIEKGKFNPSVFLAMKIAREFRCRIEDIFKLVKEDKEDD
ncbi:MAG: helix-turn-helix transcriptional regulator [Candidatus Cloacimonetes bacterium]|nr:helix-turn-helix transcriptional regulator [Candidatus Cloacimonadota bacterium]